MEDTITGKKIADLRKASGMTQQQLADELSVTNKAISKWETGRGLPDTAILPILASVLGVSIDDLMSAPTNICCDNDINEIDCSKYRNTRRYKKRLALTATVVLGILLIGITIHMIGLNDASTPSVSVGNYYLDGENTNASIQIISTNQLKLYGFDIDVLVEDIEYGTGLSGQDLDDFRAVQNLQHKYSGILDFNIELLGQGYEYAIFIFPSDNLGYFIPIVDANTLSFNGDRYIRP